MILLLTLVLSLVGAQQAQQPTIVQGKVLDGATDQPVAGARVVLARVDKPGVAILRGVYEPEASAGTQDPKANQMSAVTGDDGAFRFQIEGPAKFALFAEAAHYVRKPLEISPDTIHEAKPGASKDDIVIRLMRQSSISGRVVDADTQQPLGNLSVVPQRYRFTGNSKFLIPDGEAKTDEEGRFKLESLPPGDYYLEVRAPLGAAIGEPKPAEDFRSAVQKNYAPTWYPGVERSEEALPLKLMEWGGQEGVEIKVAKRRTASLRGRVLSDEDASARGEVTLALIRVRRGIARRGFEVIARGNLKTESEFQIDHVFPGTYYLIAEAKRLSAVLPWQVGEENQDGLDLYLRKGLTLTGRVRIDGREDRADRPALPSEGVRVELTPLTRMRMHGDPEPAVLDSNDGSFTVEDLIPDRYRVFFAKLPKGYAVSEVRYNGTVCQGGIISLDAGAQGHRLDVKLALASGSVSAAVMDGSRPVAGADVLLIPDPVADDAIDIGFDLHQARADEHGRVTISGLLPGAYRITAYPKGALWGDDSNLNQKLKVGQEVRVTATPMAPIEVRVQSSP